MIVQGYLRCKHCNRLQYRREFSKTPVPVSFKTTVKFKWICEYCEGTNYIKVESGEGEVNV